jgi:hypothetical protein
VWDTDGELVRTSSTDGFGLYSIPGLEPGTYFVATDEFGSYYTNYLDELWDDIPCYSGPPVGCDPTKGTPVTVTAGQTLRFVDFQLTPQSTGLTGTVINASDGEPVAGARIDLWDTSYGGSFEGSTTSSAAGTFTISLDPGTYVAATDNIGTFVNQIWDGIECPPNGSAYNGDCDPMLGDAILVVSGIATNGIDFALRPDDVVFRDDFETGDLGAWSATLP